jgi:hypothetical protein
VCLQARALKCYPFRCGLTRRSHRAPPNQAIGARHQVNRHAALRRQRRCARQIDVECITRALLGVVVAAAWPVARRSASRRYLSFLLLLYPFFIFSSFSFISLFTILLLSFLYSTSYLFFSSISFISLLSSFYFLSFYFSSFYFLSFYFSSFYFLSFYFSSFYFSSFYFPSLYFLSLYFPSFYLLISTNLLNLLSFLL